jgi:hypothetical protein
MRHNAGDVEYGARLSQAEIQEQRLRLAHDMIHLVLRDTAPLPRAMREALVRMGQELRSMAEQLQASA